MQGYEENSFLQQIALRINSGEFMSNSPFFPSMKYTKCLQISDSYSVFNKWLQRPQNSTRETEKGHE